MEGLAAGTLVAQRYRLSAPLGSGGQGTVWEAVDGRGEGRLCAVKFVRESRAQRTETEALLGLAHASLPRVLDFGTHEGVPFLVLERIAGTPLNATASVRVVLRALADVAGALAALHERGFVHGDVKPANVLVSADRAWLVDLGLATMARVGPPAGTLAFLAPEVLAGQRGPAADLYALGVTAALALTGRHPLVDDPRDRAALLEALSRRSRPRDVVLAGLSAPLRDAIATLLAAEPEQRPPSARAWLARLARDHGGELTTAQRTQALAHHAERPLRLPLVARDAELERAHDALCDALDGTRSTIGVVMTGPPGAGRARLVDDVIRSVQVRWSARGAAPEIVDEVPDEIQRPTIVRRIDKSADDVRATATSLDRITRFGDTSVRAVLIATCETSVGAERVDEIAIGPLSREELGHALASAAGHPLEPRALDAWFSATGGLVGRAVTLSAQLEPSAIASATSEDVAALPVRGAVIPRELGDDARAMLTALAIANEPLELEALAEICAAADVSGVVRGLAAHGWVRFEPPTVTLLARIEPGFDATIGERLEAWALRHAPARAALRARAATARGDRAAAAQHALTAARSAPSPRERIHWLAIARGERSGEVELSLGLAREWITLGEPARALACIDDRNASPAALAVRIDALRRAGRHAEARALAERHANDTDDAIRVLARITLARDALDRGDRANASTLLGRLAEGDGAPTGLEVRALETGALLALAEGETERALERIARAEPLARDALDPAQRARLSSLRGMAHQHRGRHEEGRRAYRDAWSLANDAGDLHGAATYAVNLGAAELESGALGSASQWLARGVGMLARLGRMGELARALANLASLDAFIGDRDRALEHASRAEAAARDAGDRSTEALARMVAAEASLHGVLAGDALVVAGETAESHGDSGFGADAFARAAIAYARGGDVERAESVLARADGAPVSLRSIARLEIALARKQSPGELSALRSEMRDAVAREPTLEHALDALSLAVRVADASGDADEARRARALHANRVDALAATLPESLATLFRDAHGLPPAATTETSTVRAGSTDDARWRRLVEITREINSESRLRPLLEKIMDAVIALTGAARGFLLLRSPEGVLKIRTARNIARRDLTGDEMALSRSVAERVATSGEALVTVDASTDRRLDAFESVHAMRLRSILAVPLVVQGEVVGTLYVDDRFRTQAFGDDALEVAREFAEAAAIAIHNARTKAQLRRALHRAERFSRALRKRVDAQSVELEATRRALSTQTEPRGRYDEIVGRGPAMARMLQLVDKVSPTSMPVLLLGESGTGKELIARAIHANSPRQGKAFVAENCGAIPETLLESVLFGHTKGAFTGADRTRAGLFEIADGGTLFLDEIGEMSPPMQAKLLRVLQDGEVRPLGGDRSRKVDVRVIAATHRDLGEMVKSGRFREDLYYRLAVMVVPIPPLRQRREDLPLLVGHFIEKHARRSIPVERRAMARMLGYPWPGNVRQLENEMMRACVLAEGTIREDDLSQALLVQAVAPDSPSRDPLDLRAAIEQLERQIIEQALRQHGGNQSRAAKALGLSRFGLQKKLKRLSLGSAAENAATDAVALRLAKA